MAIKVPGQLVNSSSKFPLVNAKDNQIAGLGFFTSTSERSSLPGPKRTPSFVAVMSLSSEDYLCQFVGDVDTVGDWELDRNWSRIANEANTASLLTTGAIRYNEVGNSIGGFTNQVLGDFNQDGVVNIDDFLSFFVSYVNTSATSSRTNNASEDRVSGHIGNTGAHLATWEFENYDGTNDFMLATTKAIDEQIDSKINTKDLFATNRTLSTAVAHTLSAGLTFRDSNSQSLLALSTGVAQIGGLSYPMSDGTANQVLSTNGSGVLAFRTVTDGADGADGADGTDGTNGTGFTGGSYNASTGVVTFTSNDGLGFSTGDLRGADGTNGTDGADGADGADGSDALALGGNNQTLTGSRIINMNGNDLSFKDGVVQKLIYDDGDDEWVFSAPVRFDSGGTGGEIKLREAAMGGTSGVILKAPTGNLASDLEFRLPAADGSSGQFIKTDGSGNLSFGSATQTTLTQVYSQSFLDNIGTTKHYLPFKDINEQTTIYQEEAAMLMPFDGRVRSVSARIPAITGTSGNMTIGVHTINTGGTGLFSAAAWTTEETEVVAVDTTDDHATIHFVFDNAQHFEAGDLLAISIQCSTSLFGASKYVYVSTILDYDTTNTMPSTSQVLSSNP